MTLAGTGKLIRFLLRVSRVRIALWIAGVALLVWSTAISVDRLYPTQADLDAAAAPLYGNTAVIAMLGPTFAIDTLGGQIVFKLGAFGFATMGLMGMFLVGRHTRADEEDGRTELLRATVVGRNAPVTAALLVATAAVAVTGVLITLVMLSGGAAGGGLGRLRRGHGGLRDLGLLAFGVAYGALGKDIAASWGTTRRSRTSSPRARAA